MEYRIGHLAYRVANMKETMSFYTEILGFRHAFGLTDDQGKPWIEYLLTPDGRFVELFYPDTEGVPQLGRSYMHLCLEVDDCVAAVSELRSKGIAITSDVRRGKSGNYQAWIKDPDGRDIEIMQLEENSKQYKARGTLR